MPAPALEKLPDQLEDDQVVIRRYGVGDGPLIFAMIAESRDHLRPWQDWVDTTRDVAVTKQNVEKNIFLWNRREAFRMCIAQKSDGQLLGIISLHNSNWSVPSFEVAHWLRGAAEGKGWMTRALKLACKFAFEHLGARRLYLTCNQVNLRSAAVAQRTGFKLEGILRNERLDPFGKLRDTMMFSMIPEEHHA